MKTNKSKLPDCGIATRTGKPEQDYGFLAMARSTLREPSLQEITPEVCKRLHVAMRAADKIVRPLIDGGR